MKSDSPPNKANAADAKKSAADLRRYNILGTSSLQNIHIPVYQDGGHVDK